MIIEQIYTGCLAQGAYYIESNGEAAIIDPLREIEPYLRRAESRNTKIKYVFETHFHADFVSGHVDLANKTGATIVYGPTQMQVGFDALIANDGQMFELGNIKIKLIHTPGHTLESSCYLVIDENGKERALFTGDTLFIGDVGRPDLAQKVIKDLTPEKLASMLYDSLQNKILPLPDDVIVYPAHGAGSACGKNMSKDTQDTLGNQKRTNYALRPGLTREQFMSELMDGLTPPPGYFPQNVLMNIQGYENIEKVIERGKKAMTPAEFEAVATESRAVMLDTRDPEVFAKGFIPNSINIGVDGTFAVWVGTMIPDVKTPLLIIAENGKEEEVLIRLSRVGFDNVLGYLQGSFEAWKSAGYETDSIESISVEEFARRTQNGETGNILDVRRASEYGSEHIPAAENAPLDYIDDSMQAVDKNKTYYVHCAGGYRSMIFSSILRSRGFDNLVNVQGGFGAIKKSGLFKTTDFVAPKTML